MNSGSLRRGEVVFFAHSELALRVASSVLLIAAALITGWFGGLPFDLLWAAAGAIVAGEWMVLTGVEPRRIGLILTVAGVLLAAAAASAGSRGVAGGVLALTLLVGTVVARRGRDRGWLAAGVLYASVIAIVPILARDDPAFGLAGVLWMFGVVWTTDIAAYFVGRAVGGPKLWPRISPNKTWSGFAGGTAAGAMAGWLALVALGKDAPALLVVLASAAASVAGQLGDLAESSFKRRWRVKDSSRIIPGHGGFMDRLDAFWAVSLLVGIGLAARAVLGW